MSQFILLTAESGLEFFLNPHYILQMYAPLRPDLNQTGTHTILHLSGVSTEVHVKESIEEIFEQLNDLRSTGTVTPFAESDEVVETPA
jgi:uncharacterized protein YlzI (FlbEa/FlbD family)